MAALGPAAAAQLPEAGPSVVQPPARDQRHPLGAAERRPLARHPPPPLRPLADLLRPLRALGARRHLGPPPPGAARGGGSGGGGGLGMRRGQHRRPRPPASGRRAARTRRGRKRGRRTRRTRLRAQPWGLDEQGSPQLRGARSAALGRADRGAGPTTAPNWRRCSTRSGCRAAAGGRPRKRPKCLLADKGYSYRKCRRELRRRKIPPHPRAARPTAPAPGAGTPGAARRGSTRLPIGAAMWSSGVSTGSSNSAGSPRATTSTRCAIGPSWC